MAQDQDWVVDHTHINKIYERLASMQVELDPDPLAFGPKRLNAKVAEARSMLSITERMYLEIAHMLHGFKREHRKCEAILALNKTDLLANDPEVRAGRNVTDRDAMASTKLRDDVEMVMNLAMGIQDLDAVLSVIRAKRTDLKDIQGRLRDQFKICQEEIGLGGRWGSRLPKDSTFELETGQGRAVAADAESIDDLIGEMEGEIHGVTSVTASEETPVDEVLPDSATTEEVGDFFDNFEIGAAPTNGGSTKVLPPPVEEDLDLDNILNSFDD